MAQNMPSESANVEKEVSKQFNQDDVEKLVTHILSRKNKEFILSLYPTELIYATLLPFEARNAIGTTRQN